MTLQDIIDQLSTGELRTAFLGDTTDGEPLGEYRTNALITHVKMGLTALHTRFNLKERMHVLPLTIGTQSYTLNLPDLLRIESVRDLNNDEYLINVLNDPESLHTPNYRTLDVPSDLAEILDTPTLQVFYRANHPTIDPLAKYLPLDRTEIDLPHTHLEPLVLYVASRVMNPVGMDQQFHTGNNYAAKYEQACQRLELTGYQLDQADSQNRFISNGWV